MSVTTFYRRLCNAFWSEKLWLPANITWDDISPPSTDTSNYTSASDVILYAIPLAVLLLAIRYTLERWCFRPLGLYLGLQSKPPKKIQPIPVLETAYARNGVIKHEQIVGLAKQLDWTERKVERWLRLRRASDKPTTLVKFTESCWKFVFCTSSSIFGAVCVWNEPWAWDSMLLVSDTPHTITTACWWYCMLDCSYYWSMLFSQSVDVKRKDYREMFIHHLNSIFGLSLCWTLNAHRLLTMGIVMYDASDVFLEVTKMAKYAQLTIIIMISFTLMTIVWIVTRLVWHPFCIVLLLLFGDVPMFGGVVPYVIINCLSLTTVVLDVYWTNFILRTWLSGLIQGVNKTKDSRSSDDGDTSEESNHQKYK